MKTSPSEGRQVHDIVHWVAVDASPDRVFEAVTTQTGLRCWWTEDVEAEPQPGSTALFGFGDRSVIIRMRIDELHRPDRVGWTCLGDPEEWVGTRVEFLIEPLDGGRTGVTFTHSGWGSTRGGFRQCNTDWGRLMYCLKDYLEGRSREPFMS